MVTNEPEPQPRETPEDDMDDMYEEGPRRRAWGAIASVVLALALVFVGYQWNQTASRAEALGAQVNGLRGQTSLADRVELLEKAAPARPVAAKAEKPRGTKATAATPGRPGATPVATRSATTKRAP